MENHHIQWGNQRTTWPCSIDKFNYQRIYIYIHTHSTHMYVYIHICIYNLIIVHFHRIKIIYREYQLQFWGLMITQPMCCAGTPRTLCCLVAEVAFQNRNPIHRAHFELLVCVLWLELTAVQERGKT